MENNDIDIKGFPIVPYRSRLWWKCLSKKVEHNRYISNVPFMDQENLILGKTL